MRIASINLNKRLGNPQAKSHFEKWLEDHKVDLILAQEPWIRNKDYTISLRFFTDLGGNDSVHIWIRRKWIEQNVKLLAENWQEINIGYFKIHNVYFSAYSSEERIQFLKKIEEYLLKSKTASNIIVGDFNLAPRPEDGIVNGNISNFNTLEERDALNSLLDNRNLIDFSADFVKNENIKYTIEKKSGFYSQFRCDLVIIDKYLECIITGKYDHQVRKEPNSFTDHSAIILELPVDIPASNNYALDLFENLEVTGSSRRNSYSPHKTAISRKEPSSVAKFLIEKNIIDVKNKSLLDYGCGYGEDVKWYKSQGINSVGWDPYKNFGYNTIAEGKYDIVTCIFVLNVLPNAYERFNTIKKVIEYTKKGGKIILAARSEEAILKEAENKNWQKHNDGFWSSISRQTFQKGIGLKEIKCYMNALGLEIDKITEELQTINDTTIAIITKN
ncbi:MAG: methyltransferase domain-containing protein [Melioribacteraceae bacterium]